MRLTAANLLSEVAQKADPDLTNAEMAGLETAFRNPALAYADAVREFLNGLRQEGCTVSSGGEPEEEPVRTAVVYDEDGVPIEIRFFTISPAVPDGLLNILGSIITISGLVGAPFTGGASLAFSAVSTGFLVWKNRKKETDPTRLRIYDAIGRITVKKARGVIPAGPPRSAKMGATQSELSAETGISMDIAKQALDVLVEKGVVGPTAGNGERLYWYRP